MQISRIDNRTKGKILGLVVVSVVLLSIPAVLLGIERGNSFHLTIHILALILAVFMSAIGWITFRQFKTVRLGLVFCAFTTIAVTEIVALFSFARYNSVSLDSMVTHGLILLMLLFFSFGIFRND